MVEYLITLFGKQTNRAVRLGYRNGLLFSVAIPDTEAFDEAAIIFLLGWLRLQVSEAEMLENIEDTKQSVRFRAERLAQDLTFATFWASYGYKVGNRARSEKLWNALSADDKHRCLAGVKKYNAFIARNYMQTKAYPETFLSQSRWENEFTI